MKPLAIFQIVAGVALIGTIIQNFGENKPNPNLSIGIKWAVIFPLANRYLEWLLTLTKKPLNELQKSNERVSI